MLEQAGDYETCRLLQGNVIDGSQGGHDAQHRSDDSPTCLTRLARASRSPSPRKALSIRGRTTNPSMACAICTAVKRSMRYTKRLTSTAMKPAASATENATQ